MRGSLFAARPHAPVCLEQPLRPARVSSLLRKRGSCSVCCSSPHAPEELVKLAVFVSGSGSNLKALHAATLDGRIRGRIVAVVTDRPGCGGADFARACSLPLLLYSPGSFTPQEALTPEQLVGSLRSLGVQLVCLAGFLRLVPPQLCRAFPRAVLNIHPALLPAFGGKGMYGQRVHAAVIASGARCVCKWWPALPLSPSRWLQLQRADGALCG